MTHPNRSRLGAGLALALLVAACSSATTPTAPATSSPGAGGTLPIAIDSTPVPGGSGGSAPGGDPTNPQPTMVLPGTGLTGIHQVGATKLEAVENGRDVAIRIAWWSGVAPCSVLAGVGVVPDGTTLTLTVTEGTGASGAACSAIAQYKATIVDLGVLDPGTYTIAAFGDPPPVRLTVSG